MRRTPLLALSFSLLAFSCSSTDDNVVPLAGDDAGLTLDALETGNDDADAPRADTALDSANDVPIDGDGCVVNKCLGCNVLANEPGAACGICGTSTYACTSTTTTACTKPDERTLGREVDVTSSTTTFPLSVSAHEHYGVAWTAGHIGSITSVEFSAQRVPYSCYSSPTCSVDPTCTTGCHYDLSGSCICAASGTADGDFVVTLYKGAVGAGTILATAKVLVSSVPTAAAVVTMTFATPVDVKKGDALWLALSSTSTKEEVAITGASPGATFPADYAVSHQDMFYGATGTGWASLPTSKRPGMHVNMNGCF
jgi:hypothetical protein